MKALLRFRRAFLSFGSQSSERAVESERRVVIRKSFEERNIGLSIFRDSRLQ